MLWKVIVGNVVDQKIADPGRRRAAICVRATGFLIGSRVGRFEVSNGYGNRRVAGSSVLGTGAVERRATPQGVVPYSVVNRLTIAEVLPTSTPTPVFPSNTLISKRI